MKFKTQFKKLMVYVYMPLAFLIIGYLIIYAAAKPFVDIAVSVADMMMLSSATENSDGYEDIFEHSSLLGGTVKASEIEFPTYGTRYAQLEIPTADINAQVFFGDGDKQLKLGLGHYSGSSFSGTGSTVLVAGHNHTFLHSIDKAAVGDAITLTTSYGVYVYRINDIKIKSANDSSAYDLAADEENLVLYTCYPLSTLGLTSQRYFVYAKLESGPKVLLYE